MRRISSALAAVLLCLTPTPSKTGDPDYVLQFLSEIRCLGRVAC